MKIQMFKNISQYVADLLVNKTKEEKYFEEKFNNYIDLEDYVFCYLMIDEGLKISARKKKILDKIIYEKLENGTYNYQDLCHIKSLNEDIKLEGLLKTVSPNSYQGIEQLLSSNKQQEYQSEFVLKEFTGSKQTILNYTKKLVENYKNFYKSGLDSHGDFCIKNAETPNKKSKIERLINFHIIFIKSGLLLSEDILQIKKEFTSLSKYINSQTAHTYAKGSFEKIGKERIDSYIEGLNNYYYKNDNKSSTKEDLLRQLKSYNMRQKSLNEEIKQLMIKEDYSIEKLPKEDRERVESTINLVNSFDNPEVKKFFNERLPAILKKYFSIDEEYRTSLKNVEGYNAQQLMSQSLENIERIILAKKEDNNIDLITELSIENRKLKLK